MRWLTVRIILSVLFIGLFLGILSAKTAFAFIPWDCSIGDYAEPGSCNSNFPPNQNNPASDSNPNTTGMQSCQWLAQQWSIEYPTQPISASSCSDYCWINSNDSSRYDPETCFISTTSPPNALCPRANGVCDDFYNPTFCCNYTTPSIPNCNSGISCSYIGDCLPAVNSCALNNGTQTSTGCTYTTYTGGGTCNQTTAPNQTTTCTKDNCYSGYSCVDGVCKIDGCTQSAGSPPSGCSDYNSCTYDTCNTSTGTCSHINVLDGTVYSGSYVCCNGIQTTKTTCLTFPIVSTSPATNITTTTATLNGNVTGIGEGSPTVTLFWGTVNGGEIPTNWQFAGAPSSPSQPQGIAAFSKSISSLIANTTYWFSARAIDSKGNIDWGTPLSFTTTSSGGGTGGTTAPLGTPLYKLTVSGAAMIIDGNGNWTGQCYAGPLQVSIANIVDYLGLQLNTVQLTADCGERTMFSFPNGIPSGTYILRTHYSLPGYTPESNVTITVP